MISDKIKSALSSLPFWSNMVGSQFVQGLALLVEQIGERYVQLCERALQESRLSTAVKRTSILAEAEERAYVARKSSPSIGQGLITNETSSFLNIPMGEPLVSDTGVPYIFLDSVGVGAGSSREVDIAQLELRVMEVEVTQTKPYFEVLLSREDTAVAHRVDVYVKASEESGYVAWEKSYMFRNATELSRFYTEFYKPTEQLGIRFGNGKDGLIPTVNSTVRLEVWCTLGVSALMAGEKLSFTDDIYNEGLSVETTSSIVGGQPPEDTEEIRNGAAYSTQYDDQIVWRDDYMHFLRTNIGGLVFLNVWGEQQQEEEDGQPDLKNNRTIFISAYSKDIPLEQLRNSVLDLVQALPYLNVIYRFVEPNIVGIPLTINGTIARTLAVSDVQAATAAAIEEKYGLGQIKRETNNSDFLEILEKDLWTLIDSIAVYNDFKLVIDGLGVKRKLADYRYIDTATSQFNITYGV
jgi:hypothetical protein